MATSSKLTTAQQELVLKHLYLAKLGWYLIRKWGKIYSIPQDDALQISMLAICRSVINYDEKLGSSLEIHCKNNIWYAIKDALKTINIVHIPHDQKRIKDSTYVEALEKAKHITPITDTLTTTEDIGAEIDRKEWHEQFTLIKDTLPPEEKEIINMRLFGIELRECAKIKKTSYNAVKYLNKKGVEKIYNKISLPAGL